jgi:hypothetical protein
MALKRAVLLGQRYRDVQPGRFAVPAQEWAVEAVFTGADGIGHARLVGVLDPTQRKTLSVFVLLDHRRFHHIESDG